MCITLPAKVLVVTDWQAEVELNGRRQKVKLGAAEKISVGDWVLTTGDFLIKRISAEEAEEINGLLGEYKFTAEQSNNKRLKIILEKSLEGDLTEDDLAYLLNLENESDLEVLYSQANVSRKSNIKDHICVHGIIEFSNYCRNDCVYCGLRNSNRQNLRYRLEPEEIIDIAVKAVNQRGYKLLVLQSGEDEYYSQKIIENILRGIKDQARVFIYLSIGQRPLAEYEAYRQAGANGILMRFETSNSDLYQSLKTNDTLEQRLSLIRSLKKMGYVISSGMMIGLPNQSVKDIAKDILLMKELGVFMPSFGPFIPTAGTPLADARLIDSELILKVLSATRLAIPNARLPITTAMETICGESIRQKGFMAGANSVMFNLTPDRCRSSYKIYDNKFYDKEKRYEKWALFKGDLSYDMLENELKMTI